MDEKEQVQWEKRKVRRKRRIRSQIAACTVLAVVIMALAAGIVFGARFLLSYSQEKKQQEEQDRQDKINDLLSTEEDLVTPKPEGSESREEEEEEEPPAPEPTPQEVLDSFVDAVIQSMPLEDKVAGLFIVTPESITGVGTAVKAGDGTRTALEKYGLF